MEKNPREGRSNSCKREWDNTNENVFIAYYLPSGHVATNYYSCNAGMR